MAGHHTVASPMSAIAKLGYNNKMAVVPATGAHYDAFFPLTLFCSFLRYLLDRNYYRQKQIEQLKS